MTDCQLLSAEGPPLPAPLIHLLGNQNVLPFEPPKQKMNDWINDDE